MRSLAIGEEVIGEGRDRKEWGEEGEERIEGEGSKRSPWKASGKKTKPQNSLYR